MKIKNLVSKAVFGRGGFFHQPHPFVPESIDNNKLYYYDLSDRVDYPGECVDGMPIVNVSGSKFIHPVVTAQRGLGLLQRSDVDKTACGKALRLGYSSVEYFSECHYSPRYPVEAYGSSNWKSAMAQGQLSSYWARMFHCTNDEVFRVAAIKSISVMLESMDSGGCSCVDEGGRIMFMEVSHNRAPFILNGHIVSMFGLYDVIKMCDYDDKKDVMRKCVADLKHFVSEMDVGWSLYDTSKFSFAGLTIRNYASPFYHEFHVELLKAINLCFGVEADVLPFIKRWEGSLVSTPNFVWATVAKVVYKLLSERGLKRRLAVR